MGKNPGCPRTESSAGFDRSAEPEHYSRRVSGGLAGVFGDAFGSFGRARKKTGSWVRDGGSSGQRRSGFAESDCTGIADAGKFECRCSSADEDLVFGWRFIHLPCLWVYPIGLRKQWFPQFVLVLPYGGSLSLTALGFGWRERDSPSRLLDRVFSILSLSLGRLTDNGILGIRCTQ